MFPEPEGLLSEAPVVLGTDGRKMSKSRGNAIELRATADETVRAIRSAQDRLRPAPSPTTRSAAPRSPNLLLIASLCTGDDDGSIADEIGSAGPGA